MIVYRVEGPEGRGPYHGHNSPLQYRRSGGDPDPKWDSVAVRNPGPDEDIGDDWYALYRADVHRNFGFGFETPEQLYQWFGDILPAMYQWTAYRVVLYEVLDDTLVRGKRQVAFPMQAAVPLGPHPTPELLYDLGRNAKRRQRRSREG